MSFKELLLDVLLEGRIDDTINRHPSIPFNIKQQYLKKIPNNNAQHLDWVLQQHTKGNIKPGHNINEILSNFNKVKDKLDKKQIHQYKNVDELQNSISSHIDSIQKTKKEKQEEGTEVLYSSPTMTIRQHHNYESCIKAAMLPKNNNEYENTNELGKASWCISADSKEGLSHYHNYSSNGLIYSIEHHHPDGTSNKHMLVYNPYYNQDLQELRDENDNMVLSENNLLDNYSRKYNELKNTPIANIFSSNGRKKLKQNFMQHNDKIYNIIKDTTHNSPILDDNFDKLFEIGNQKGNHAIHRHLAQNPNLTNRQVDKIINNGHSSSLTHIAKRDDLNENQINILIKRGDSECLENILNNNKLSNSNMTNMLKHKLDSDIYDKMLDTQDLSESHINSIVKNSNTGTRLNIIRKKNITDNNVSNLIHYGNSLVHNELTTKKLSDNNISKLISTNNNVIHRKLLDHDLNESHLHSIIDNGSLTTLIPVSRHPNLNDSHIRKLVDKKHPAINMILSTRHDLSPDLHQYIKNSERL